MTGLSYDSGDYERNLMEALKVSEYETLRTMQRRAREDGRLVGIGLASWVDITGTGAQAPQTAAISVTSTRKSYHRDRRRAAGAGPRDVRSADRSAGSGN